MKKFVLLLLVLSLLCLPGCKLFNKVGIGKKASPAATICEIARSAKPTKIITDVKLATSSGDTLSGYYVTVTDGTNAIFEYTYDRVATPEDSLATGSSDRIVTEKGTINYKDGAYSSGDAESWRPGTGTALELKLNFDDELFKNATVSEDGQSLEVKMGAEALKTFIGTDLNATGEATVTVSTNGRNLTMITISCATATGTLSVRTSYTYNRQDLSAEA